MSDILFDKEKLNSYEVFDAKGNKLGYHTMGQGNATPATQGDISKDAEGFTNPNLHRRIDIQEPPKADNTLDQEIAKREYNLAIQNVHSYRTTKYNVHDEESTNSEIP